MNRETPSRNEDSCSHAARSPCMDQTVALNIRTGPRGRWPTSSATSAPANDARPAARCDGHTAGKGGFWDQLHERGLATTTRGPAPVKSAIRTVTHGRDGHGGPI